MKFQADVVGNVAGIRFYKGASNTGTHIGNLWDSGGALLASATFVNETASGWQTVLFGDTGGDSSQHDLCGVVPHGCGLLLGEYGLLRRRADLTIRRCARWQTEWTDPTGSTSMGRPRSRAVRGTAPTTGSMCSSWTETQAPTVSVTTPEEGETVSGSAVPLSATATDNVGVVGVQFQVNGANEGAEDTTHPTRPIGTARRWPTVQRL